MGTTNGKFLFSTDRTLRLLKHQAEGMSSYDIGLRLGCTKKQVLAKLDRIKEGYDWFTRAGLIRWTIPILSAFLGICTRLTI